MSSFNIQIEALMESAQSICNDADKSSWNGEGWSPPIILGHLVDVDTEVWMPRFEMMRDAKNQNSPIPQLSWWEPDAEETEEKYAGIPLEKAKSNFQVSRRAMQRFLKGLTVEEQTAAALHKTFGEITIGSMLQIILDHDQEHRASLN
jgi:hypothetical protein